MIKKMVWGVIFLLVAAVFLAWITQDKWLPDWNKELAEQTTEFQQKGLALGKTADQQTCLEEALLSFNQCSGFSCTIKHGKFLKACWANATPTENFCEGVPEFREKRTEDDKSWARHACWSRDIRGEGCRLLMRQQQQFCSKE